MILDLREFPKALMLTTGEESPKTCPKAIAVGVGLRGELEQHEAGFGPA